MNIYVKKKSNSGGGKMKNVVSVLVIIVSMVLLVSCASTPVASDASIDSFVLPQNPTKDSAVIYVVRPSIFGMVIKFNVYLDSKEEKNLVGSTKGGEYIFFKVAPGSHTILSQAENLAKCDITVEPNKVYFVQQVPKMGLLYAQNQLVVMNNIEGRKNVKKLKQGIRK